MDYYEDHNKGQRRRKEESKFRRAMRLMFWVVIGALILLKLLINIFTNYG